ncbi:MAG: hypothetical protein AAGH67_08495 [Cyanobacteria bacterium P01_H01_bin.162]
MDFIYHLGNASLTLRIVEHLLNAPTLPLAWLTVIHQIDGWVIKVRMHDIIEAEAAEDFRAYLNELGIPHEPNIRLRMALWALETGQSPVDVMRRYQVAVVSHGRPEREEIEAFRNQFVMGLGYCPETLA